MELQEMLSIVEIVIIAFTAIFTAITYFKNKRDELKNKAIIIVFQIREIEQNIEDLRDNAAKSNFVWSAEFYKSREIFEDNYWEQSKGMLIKKISNEDYSKLEEFYNIASTILREQKIIRKEFFRLIEIKQKEYYQKQIDIHYEMVKKKWENKELIDEEIKLEKEKLRKSFDYAIDEFIPVINNDIIQSQLQKYIRLSSTTTYERIKKIAKIDK